MRMVGTSIDMQVAHGVAAKRATRDHALYGFLDHTGRKTAIEDLVCSARLDAARITGVP